MNGNEILGSLRQLARFYSDCALLLKTAEACLADAGWQNVTGNRGIADLSKSIEYPEFWPPYYAFRFFGSDRHKSLMAFVSVIFDLPEEPRLITEPLVSAGWFEFGEGVIPDDKEYYFATLHLWMPNRKDDGTFFQLDPRKEWPDEGYKISQLTTLAVPLVSVTNSQCLRDRVIEPLLRRIADSDPDSLMVIEK